MQQIVVEPFGVWVPEWDSLDQMKLLSQKVPSLVEGAYVEGCLNEANKKGAVHAWEISADFWETKIDGAVVTEEVR